MPQKRASSRPEYTPREGQITALTPQKKQPDRVSVSIDGQFAFGLWRRALERFSLSVGQVLTVEKQRDVLEAENVEKARQVAIGFLEYKPRTTREVRDRLRRDGYPDHVVEDLLADMLERRWLDDQAYAAAYAESRMASHGYGPRRIRQELSRRGVDRSIIETVMTACLEEVDESAMVDVQAEKRWRRLQSEDDMRKRKKRLLDYLVRRGFSYSVARDATERIASEEGNTSGE